MLFPRNSSDHWTVWQQTPRHALTCNTPQLEKKKKKHRARVTTNPQLIAPTPTPTSISNVVWNFVLAPPLAWFPRRQFCRLRSSAETRWILFLSVLPKIPPSCTFSAFQMCTQQPSAKATVLLQLQSRRFESEREQMSTEMIYFASFKKTFSAPDENVE